MENMKIVVIINQKNFIIYIMKIIIKYGMNAKQIIIILHVVYAQTGHILKILYLKPVKNVKKGNLVILKIRLIVRNALGDIIQIF